MIIECPNCGVPGRIPEEAVGRIRIAHCTLCDHRFELKTPSSALASVDPRGSGLGAPVEEGLDPCSSSYELKALTEEDAGRHRGDGPVVGRDVRTPEAPVAEPMVQERHVAGTLHRAAHADAVAVGTVGRPRTARLPAAAEPWYSRVLQVWGIVFLIWAGVLLIRSLNLMLASPGDAGRDPDVVPTTIAMLLLVPGAAGLFLLVDLGRYIRSMQASQIQQEASPSSEAASNPLAAPPRRSWRPRHASLRFLGTRTG